MKRRDFLKGAVVGAGLFGSGMLPGRAKADDWGKKRHGKDFYRIDSYCHFSQLDYITELEALNGSGQLNSQRALIQRIKSMYDVGDRLKMMDACGIDVSILGPQPFIETAGPGVYANPTKALQAAQYINNEIAGIVAQHPHRFKWVALLPTNLPSSPANVDIMLKEFTRAVTNNDPSNPLASAAVGGCFIVSPTAKPPDHADYLKLYAKAVELNVPLWIHPGRPLTYPDYLSDPAIPGSDPPIVPSKYYLFLLLDWLLDSSVAMARIAFSGVFNDTLHPELFPKLIIHHKGALVPLFQNRLTYDLYQTIPGLSYGIDPSVPQPYLDLFKNFYCDTVFSGNASFETEIVQIAYDFFGPDHVLFGTDASFSTNDGKDGTLNARYSVEALQLRNKDIQNIFSNNILNIIPH
jgi:predicted TIM-barrel fold metal-dependent hydrolase